MYRDDELARSERANILIDEIAELERLKVLQAASDKRLEVARQELAGLQGKPVEPEKAPSLAYHVLVFGTAAVATFTGYTMLF